MVAVDEQHVQRLPVEQPLQPESRLFAVGVPGQADDSLSGPCEPLAQRPRVRRDAEVDRNDQRVRRAHARQQVEGAAGRGTDLAHALRMQALDPLERRDDFVELLRRDHRLRADPQVDELLGGELEQPPVRADSHELPDSALVPARPSEGSLALEQPAIHEGRGGKALKPLHRESCRSPSSASRASGRQSPR